MIILTIFISSCQSNLKNIVEKNCDGVRGGIELICSDEQMKWGCVLMSRGDGGGPGDVF